MVVVEKPSAVKANNNNGGFEANTMAILDSYGVKDPRDAHDDKLTFLEAVRTVSLISDSPTAPSWNMFDAIFQILRGSNSLELAMSSYQLLTDLDKHYPRIYLTGPDNYYPYIKESNNPVSSSYSAARELVVVKEAWSPFWFGSESSHCDREGSSRNSLHMDSSRFCDSVEEICKAVSTGNSQFLIKSAENMLMFQYLISVLETDFVSRHTSYKETTDWVLMRESLLSTLLGSRRLIFKSVVRDCMSIISKRCQHNTEDSYRGLKDTTNISGSAKVVQDCEEALAFAATNLERQTCTAMQRLLTLTMELDVIKKEADLHGLTSRADSVRTPVLDVILDELTYNKDVMPPFFEVFAEDKWKLEIVLQYCLKYCPKPSVRTRRSRESLNDTTFQSILSYFSSAANAKTFVRQVPPEDAQLLLAHLFQAYLSLHRERTRVSNFVEKVGSSSLSQICNGLITALLNIRKIDEESEIAPLVKEAFFSALAIASSNVQED